MLVPVRFGLEIRFSSVANSSWRILPSPSCVVHVDQGCRVVIYYAEWSLVVVTLRRRRRLIAYLCIFADPSHHIAFPPLQFPPSAVYLRLLNTSNYAIAW